MAYIENYYIDKYGVQFSEDKKTLIAVPEDYKGIYEIPFGTITVEPDAFFNCKHITAIIIPSTVEDIFESYNGPEYVVDTCTNLASFIVDSQNKTYYTIEGVLCKRGIDDVIAYPPAKKDIFVLPPNLSIDGALWNSLCILKHLVIEDSHSLYTMKDGAIYNKELSTLIKVPINQHKYIMPDSIEDIELGALNGCEDLKEVRFGASLHDLTGNGQIESYQAFLQCKSLEKIEVDSNNSNFYTDLSGYLYLKDLSDEETLIFCPNAKKTTFWRPDTCAIGSKAFADCMYFKGFEEWSVICNDIEFIGEDAFVDTPFYENKENWIAGKLCIDNILIKVSDGFTFSKIVIPNGISRIVTINSITNIYITDIEINSTNNCFFNSGAINCPNLRTIKFPKTLSAWYLEHYRISLKENAPHLEKILIPKGMRDFFLMYSSLNLFELMIEYDSEGVETPIAPLSKEEWDFYKGPHLNGIPNYTQYKNVKKEFLGGNALTGQQIATILESSANNAGLQSCSLIGNAIDNVAKCFERDGYKFISMRYGGDFIYFIEPHKCKK